MIDSPQFLQTVLQPAAIIHLTIPRDQIRTVMGPGIGEIMETLRAQGVAPAGRWYTRHLKMDPGVFDFEIGVPVPKAVNPAGRVVNGQIPAASVARAIYRGSYEGLASAWPELDAWIVAQGKKPGPSLWETYLTDPSSNPDPSTWTTELTRPLV